MYIRATKTHTRKGEARHTYRLVRSDRIGGKVRQSTLLNLGVHFDTPREQWGALVLHIENLLQGQPTLVFDPDLQHTAEAIVAQLRARGIGAHAKPEGEPDSVMTVDMDSLEHPEHARSVGAERVCLQALEDLGLKDTLIQAGAKERDARLAVALVVARMLHPNSERATLQWLQSRSTTLDLLGLRPGRKVSLAKLYRIGDLLWEHNQAIQQALFQKERTLLSLPETVVFYDLTNAHYHGQQHGEYLAYGRSKQKRSDCPLVTLGLVLDGAGFPRTCEILPGNVSEPGTLQDAIERLNASVDGQKPTVVMDAGIATEANVSWLAEQGYDWICVHRGRRPLPPEREPDSTLTTQAGHAVRVWQLQQTKQEMLLYAVSEARKHKEEQILQRRRTLLEAALTSLHEGLQKPYRTKRFKKVVEQVGRIKERYARVSHQYEVTVVEGSGPNAKAVKFARKTQWEEADGALGGYVLRTSQTGWDLKHIVATYWRLSEVEATFRSLKSELGMRPLYHSKDARIAAHISIAVYAYHAVHLIRTRLKAQGIHASWKTLRQQLSAWQRVMTTIKDTQGQVIVNVQDERPRAELAQIARICGVTPSLHRQRYVRQD